MQVLCLRGKKEKQLRKVKKEECLHVYLPAWVRLPGFPSRPQFPVQAVTFPGAETWPLLYFDKETSNHSPLRPGIVEKAAEQHALLVVWKTNPQWKWPAALAPPPALRSRCQLWLAFLTRRFLSSINCSVPSALAAPPDSMWWAVTAGCSDCCPISFSSRSDPGVTLLCLCRSRPSDPPAVGSPTPAVWSHCLSTQYVSLISCSFLSQCQLFLLLPAVLRTCW